MLWIQRPDDRASDEWELWCGSEAQPLLVTLPGRIGVQLERLFTSERSVDQERTAVLDVALVDLVDGLGGGTLSAPTPLLSKILEWALRAGALPPPGGSL